MFSEVALQITADQTFITVDLALFTFIKQIRKSWQPSVLKGKPPVAEKQQIMAAIGVAGETRFRRNMAAIAVAGKTACGGKTMKHGSHPSCRGNAFSTKHGSHRFGKEKSRGMRPRLLEAAAKTN